MTTSMKINNTRLTCKIKGKLKFDFLQCWIGKKTSQLNDFLIKKIYIIIFGFLGKVRWKNA